MNPEVKQVFKSVSIATVCFMAAVLLLAGVFWPAPSRWMALAGIVYGCLIGEIGFYMICMMACSIDPDPKAAKKKGALHYSGRYAFYALSLFAGAWLNLPPLAMLAGILCSKLALAASAVRRKDTR